MRIPAPRISARAVGASLGAGAAGAVASPPLFVLKMAAAMVTVK